MKSLLFFIASLLLFVHSSISMASSNHAKAILQAEPASLVFGVVPQQSATTLIKRWGPVLHYLEKKTGISLSFKTAPSIPQFEQKLSEGEYDIAYMNPYHYTVFSQQPGYRAFAREKGKYIQGIVVVQKNSLITSINELESSTIAFPAPAAFAASILPQAMFAQRGITIHPRYVSSHDSVYRTVEKGLLPAGGGIMRTLDNIDANIKNNLRILWKSELYTAHAFAAHPRVSVDALNQLVSAMIVMGQSEEGLVLLDNLKFQGLIRARDADWNDVRSLRLPALKPLD